MSTPLPPSTPQSANWGALFGSAAHRWARLGAALIIVILAARTRFAPLSYIVLLFAAAAVFMKDSAKWASKATAFWAPKPPATT